MLLSRRPGYQLCGSVRVDLHRVQRLAEQGRAAAAAGRAAEAATALRAALERHAGPVLGGLAGPPVAAQTARLEEQRLALVEEWVDA